MPFSACPRTSEKQEAVSYVQAVYALCIAMVFFLRNIIGSYLRLSL